MEYLCNNCKRIVTDLKHVCLPLLSTLPTQNEESLKDRRSSNPYDFYDEIDVNDNVKQTEIECCKTCNKLNSPNHKCELFQCDHCSKIFQYKTSLKMHLNNFHSTSKDAIPCLHCKFLCATNIIYIKHLESHNKTKSFTCTQCKNSFMTKYNLLRHSRATGCNGLLIFKYPCRVCHKKFTRKDNLREHLRKHISIDMCNQYFQCNSCGENFMRKSSLITHLKKHTGERNFPCEICHDSFKTKGSLVKHRRRHTGEKPFSCQTCNRCFAAKETLNRHIKTHSEWKPHKCSECGKTFIQQSQLRNHMFYHTGIAEFKCKHCNVAFPRKSNLISHIKYTHEEGKKVQCPVEKCLKQFINRSTLKRHLKVHTTEKPFGCDDCSKTFKTKALLEAHKRTHLKETPRSCPKCPRAFIRADCLIRHMRTKHPDLYIALRMETQKTKFERVKAETKNMEIQEFKTKINQ